MPAATGRRKTAKQTSAESAAAPSASGNTLHRLMQPAHILFTCCMNRCTLGQHSQKAQACEAAEQETLGTLECRRNELSSGVPVARAAGRQDEHASAAVPPEPAGSRCLCWHSCCQAECPGLASTAPPALAHWNMVLLVGEGGGGKGGRGGGGWSCVNTWAGGCKLQP